jgi:hypothetical protein
MEGTAGDVEKMSPSPRSPSPPSPSCNGGGDGGKKLVTLHWC